MIRSTGWLLVLLVVLSCAQPARAAACVPDLLSNYILLGSGGCDVGPFTVKTFSFTPIATTIVIADTDITVTPVFGTYTYGLQFSSAKFSVSGSDFAKYLLAYTWDPGDIRSLEDILNDPVVNPGLVKVTTDACKDAPFTGAVCPNTTATITISDDGNTAVPFDSTVFSPTIGTVGIRNTIDLQGNGASAQMDDFVNRLVVTPEPATLAAGLFAMALACYRAARVSKR